jgi:ABC-type proline/glycine betaine transport system permease subunit
MAPRFQLEGFWPYRSEKENSDMGGFFQRRGVRMTNNVEIGVAGSITVSLLVIAVALLLRSFYRRYTRMENRKDDESN